jgi:hypothetical protein
MRRAAIALLFSAILGTVTGASGAAAPGLSICQDWALGVQQVATEMQGLTSFELGVAATEPPGTITQVGQSRFEKISRVGAALDNEIAALQEHCL